MVAAKGSQYFAFNIEVFLLGNDGDGGAVMGAGCSSRASALFYWNIKTR